MLFVLLSIIRVPHSYNWVVFDPNMSSSDTSPDVFLKIVLSPLDTMEMRLKSPDV